MIELKRHIEILLLDNDCVIVPGLGGFVAHYVSARYDETDNSYLPPSRTLGFNAKLDMNDSLIAQSYVEAYDMSYPEAVSKIEAEVDEIKRALERDGYYDFSDLGTLVVNPDGNYEFSPCESGILTPNLYALSSFDIEKIDFERTSGHTGVVTVYSSPEPETQVQNDAVCNLEPDFPYGESKLAESIASKSVGDNGTISIKVSILRNFLAVACAVVAFFLLTSPINNNDKPGEVVSGVGLGLMYNLVPDNTKAKPRQLVMPSAGNDKVNALPAKPDSSARSSVKRDSLRMAIIPRGSYSIVLACRITKSNAEAYVQKLQEAGYTQARVLEREHEYLKVVYGSYESESVALQNLKGLHNNPEFENAWIYKDNK